MSGGERADWPTLENGPKKEGGSDSDMLLRTLTTAWKTEGFRVQKMGQSPGQVGSGAGEGVELTAHL